MKLRKTIIVLLFLIVSVNFTIFSLFALPPGSSCGCTAYCDFKSVEECDCDPPNAVCFGGVGDQTYSISCTNTNQCSELYADNCPMGEEPSQQCQAYQQ